MIGNSRKTLVRITRKAALMASFCALASTPLGCPEDLCSLVRALPGGPDDPSGGEPTHLAVGDSITASNKDVCQSLACHAGIALGVHVQNNAIGGTRLSSDGDDPDDIPNQYEPGHPWEWVIVTGGGNDMRGECGCSVEGHDPAVCEQKLDELADPASGTGDMFDLIDLVQADGARVAIVGYYQFPDDSMGNFDGCNVYGGQLNERYREIADADPDVTFVETAAAIDFDTHPEYFLWDHVHPSAEGSLVIGNLVAAAIASP
ncbi:MAG: SGNH/GDSL hydrolase family protein [Myxococcota bacterium]|jgi:lysophospholipase L1-like esterase|nr:SGNH/GDSL hydrolase family protein [Myxococcota bacterium]